MAEYRGVNNVARKIIKKYRGVGNVAREICKEYRGVNNIARLFFSSMGCSLSLYDNGTENIDITGGLNSYPYCPDTSESTRENLSITMSDSSITLYSNSSAYYCGGTFFTENMINLTNVNTLKIEVSSVDAESGGYVRVGATKTKVDRYIVEKAKTIRETGTIEVDISSLSDEHYLFIALYGTGTKSITFTKWWIE